MSTPRVAQDRNDAERSFQVVHPFHPLYGQRFSLVTVRNNWGVDRVYYQDRYGQLAYMPASWTDAVAPDPVVVVSAGRSPFRLEDLLELTRLVAALRQEASHER